MSDTPTHPSAVAMITGGSSGLGLVIAETFLRSGYRVVIVGRDGGRLQQATDQLRRIGDQITGLTCDLTVDEQVQALFARVAADHGRLDVLVNCVGTSDRGLIEQLSVERLQQSFQQNVVTTLLCCQAAIGLLEQTGGVIVNISSLAGKVGARYLGGYAIAKHALSGLTQQLRLECKPRGVHVALVSPGPIQRADAGTRYQAQIDTSLPDQASAPGAGTRLKGLPPQQVADAVLRCVRRRQPDVMLPQHLRALVALGHALPRLGDWLLLKFTSSK